MQGRCRQVQRGQPNDCSRIKNAQKIYITDFQEHRILAVPGRGFGAPGHFRLAFSVPDETIERSAAGFRAAVQGAAAA